MKKLDFTIGLIFLIVLTIIIYNVFGFEITIIFLIIDLSVGVSYQFSKLNKFIELVLKESAAMDGPEIEIDKFDTIFLLKTNNDLGIEEGYITSYEKAEEHMGGGYYFETSSDPDKAIKFEEEDIKRFEEDVLGDLRYEKHRFIRLTQEDYQKIMKDVKGENDD